MTFMNRRSRDKIYKAAKTTYSRIMSRKYPELLKNSCDFELLEQKNYEYIEMMNEDESASQAPIIL